MTLSLGYNSQQPKGLFKRLSGVINLPIMPIFIPAGVLQALVVWGIQSVRIIQVQVHVQINRGHKKKTSSDEKLPSLTFQVKKGSHEAGQPGPRF